AQAGFNLAVAQVVNLWPPLWAFIQEGFAALWQLVSNVFVLRMTEGIANVGDSITRFLSSVLPAHVVTAISAATQAVNVLVAGQVGAAVERAQVRLQAAVNAFHVVESA